MTDDAAERFELLYRQHFRAVLRLQPRAGFTLFRNGTKLVSLGKASGAVVHIPAGPASYRAVLNVNLTHDAGFSQSTQTHTDLTVRYVPGAIGGSITQTITRAYTITAIGNRTRG